MTIDDIIGRHKEESIWLSGAELQAFCDLVAETSSLQATYAPLADILAEVRKAPYLLGQRDGPRSWLDETPRINVLNGLGREWFIEC